MDDDRVDETIEDPDTSSVVSVSREVIRVIFVMSNYGVFKRRAIVMLIALHTREISADTRDTSVAERVDQFITMSG